MKDGWKRPNIRGVGFLWRFLWFGLAFQLGTFYGATLCSHCPADNDPRRMTSVGALPEGALTIPANILSIPLDTFLRHVPLAIPKKKRNPTEHSTADVVVIRVGPKRALSSNKVELAADRTESMERLADQCTSIKAVTTRSSEGACIALMDIQESPHVHYFEQKKKSNNKSDAAWKRTGRFKSTVSLSSPPKPVSTREMERLLSQYFAAYEDILDDLRPIAAQSAAATKTGGCIVVMVCNTGHAELLLNFVCSANKIGVDLSNYLLFATDETIWKAAKQWGLKVLYHQELSSYAPKVTDDEIEYGSKAYAKVMMSKVQCAHLVSSLGYDFVFLDVDIVPYKVDFIEQFLSYSNGEDMIFQYDHSEDPIYQPWSANSGFYFVRNNQKTQNFFSSLLRAGDMILRSKSHQAVLNIMLGEHVSLYGMKVRVLADESDEFPGTVESYARRLLCVALTITPYAWYPILFQLVSTSTTIALS